MPYNKKSLENLIPFSGSDDPRRCNGRPANCQNKKTRLRNNLYNAFLSSNKAEFRNFVGDALRDAVIHGSTDTAEVLFEIASYGEKVRKQVDWNDIEFVVVDGPVYEK